MTKKDYIRISAVLRRSVKEVKSLRESSETLSDLASDLAVVFASDNPRFDQDKFLAACRL